MSDQTNTNNNQTIVLALVVVAVLLAAIVGVLIYQQSKAATPVVPPAATTGTGGDQPPGNATQQPPGPFDPKTATKVPKGSTPEAFVKAYNEALISGDFKKAYDMLPLDKKTSYGDATQYGDQVKGYGINGYKMGKPVEKGDIVSIAAVQENPSMPITYTWNFKKVGKQWYVQSRVMGGSVQ